MLKRKLITVSIFFVLMPVLILLGYFFVRGKQYYIVSLIVCVLSFVPFFMSLERKKLQARELVTLASITALAVASRAAFFFLEQAKPTAAIVILAAIAFGPEFGFSVGALSMLLSNMIFGQGMWTPFQMLGMGLTAYVCGLVFHRSFKKESVLFSGFVCGVCCFAVYGFIVDSSSVLMWVPVLSLKSVLPIYASGLVFNAIHGIVTGILIMCFGKPVFERMTRVKVKYQLFGEKNEKEN